MPLRTWSAISLDTERKKPRIPKEQGTERTGSGYPPGQFYSERAAMGTGQRYSFRAQRESR